MKAIDVLTEAYSRLEPLVEASCTDLTEDQLEFRPDADANSIGWLIWHLTRVQDDHIAALVHDHQVWSAGSWRAQFQLDLSAADTGYGHTSADVAKVHGLTPELLLGYYKQTHTQTLSVLRDFTDADLDTVIDESWDPPVTAGARLVSVLGECFAHLGQAAYIRGLVERRVS